MSGTFERKEPSRFERLYGAGQCLEVLSRVCKARDTLRASLMTRPFPLYCLSVHFCKCFHQCMLLPAEIRCLLWSVASTTILVVQRHTAIIHLIDDLNDGPHGHLHLRSTGFPGVRMPC
jgi:hypothetical protein